MQQTLTSKAQVQKVHKGKHEKLHPSGGCLSKRPNAISVFVSGVSFVAFGEKVFVGSKAALKPLHTISKTRNNNGSSITVRKVNKYCTKHGIAPFKNTSHVDCNQQFGNSCWSCGHVGPD